MRYWDAVLSFAVAAVIAWALTPLAARLARRIGAVDRPRERGLAVRETPLLGGLAILVAVLVAAAIWMPDTIKLPRTAHAAGAGGTVYTWGVLAGACLIAIIGAIDDIRDLPPLVKLVGQIIAALIAVESGAVVTDVTLPFVGALQFPNAGGFLTVVWLVGLMNVVNFSDGVDGLAAGICMIDGIAFSVIAFDLGVSGAAILAALTAGAALGFLFHNFHPASVFMGDAGANLLGYLLGTAAVAGTLKTNAVVALVVPLVVLAIPFLDTGFVVAKRLKYRRKPWSADANHFHHRMARIGFSQRKTVAYLYGWTLLMALLAVALRIIPHHHLHQPVWVALLIVLALACLAASIYLVYVLEIFKFKGLRATELRSADPDTSEHQIDQQVARDIETGDFERVNKSMEKANLEQLESFITADGSAIRELAGPAWTAARHQSLAEATLEPGGETAEHYHPKAEELYYFVSGHGRMRLADSEDTIGPGDCVVIAPGTPHKLWNTGQEPLVLLCCCAPAYRDDDTVMTGR